MMNQIKLEKMLKRFFIEDIGERDITSQSIFPKGTQGQGTFLAKSAGIIAGLPIIETAYRMLDGAIDVQWYISEGEYVNAGDTIAKVNGEVTAILSGERVILNLLQRMSGIATLTQKSVATLNDPSIQICDTRKTTPGLRMLEKYAVVKGGGINHRRGLYDGVMIKDNHIAFRGSITKAVEAVRKNVGHMVKIEVETESKDDVLEAVSAGADVIMFDNRSPEEIKELVTLVPDPIVTEASGGITLDTLASYRHTGVDYISLGYLTHSVSSFDISLNVVNH